MDLAHRGLARSAATLSAAALLAALLVSPASVSARDSLVKQVADGKMKPLVIRSGGVSRQVHGLSGGVLASAQAAPTAPGRPSAATGAPAPSINPRQLGVAADALGCGKGSISPLTAGNAGATGRRLCGGVSTSQRLMVPIHLTRIQTRSKVRLGRLTPTTSPVTRRRRSTLQGARFSVVSSWTLTPTRAQYP